MGVVTAKALGLALIVASASCCDVADTVAVQVTQVPAEVVVSPSSHTLKEGESHQLSGVVKDAMGYVIPGVEVVWSSDDASIASVDGAGIVTGQKDGKTQVRGVHADLQGPATVTVTGSAAPPGDPSTLYPNQPSSMTVLDQWDGTQHKLDGWNYWRGESTCGWDTCVRVIEDSTNPLGTGYSLRFEWPAGGRGSGCAGRNSWDLPNGGVRELYIMYRVFYSPDWYLQNKQFYIGTDIANRGSGNNNQYYVTSPLLNLTVQWGGTYNALEKSNAVRIGMWQNIELLLIAESSPGAGDGKAHYWVDGDLKASNNSVRWVRPEDPSVFFDGVQWYAVQSGDTAAATWFKVGEFYMSGK